MSIGVLPSGTPPLIPRDHPSGEGNTDGGGFIDFSREEALWFFDTDDPSLIQQGFNLLPDVVVTDGAAPVRWKFGSESGLQVAFQPPSVVDTTGAGDAFTAGLLHRWAAAPSERIRFAAACGALVCGGPGGIDPQPTQGQVEQFLGGVS